MGKKKDYHKQPRITFRLNHTEDKEDLEFYAKKHKISVGWIMKKSVSLFWEAVNKGKIKL